MTGVPRKHARQLQLGGGVVNRETKRNEQIMNFNAVQFAGNITRDPEMRYTKEGVPVTNFSVASNRIFKDSQENKKEETTFMEVVAWNKRAEVVAQYFKKGDPIFVTGRLMNNDWTDKDGAKRYKTVIIMDSFCFVSGKKDSSSGANGTTGHVSKVDDADVPGYQPERDAVPF